MYLDEKIDLIHQMSWKINCKRFGCRISYVNIRNPILAKPHIWGPKIVIFSYFDIFTFLLTPALIFIFIN